MCVGMCEQLSKLTWSSNLFPIDLASSVSYTSLVDCLGIIFDKNLTFLNISATPSDFRPLPHPFILYAPWTDGSFLSLGLGQPWPCLDLLPLLPLLFGIAFHLQLVLLFYHPISLRPYHFLKLVSFLELIEPEAPLFAYGCLRGAI